MTYQPELDDYVQWGNHTGWVYFKCEQYITIELGVKPKPNCEYTKIEKHRYIHTLLLCHIWNQGELEYIYSRKNRDGRTLEEMQIYDKFVDVDNVTHL